MEPRELGAEVFLGLLEGFDHPGANGDGVDEDHELAQAVGLGHLERRRDVDVGLSRAGLHLDREVREVARLALEVVVHFEELQLGLLVNPVFA